MKREMQLSPEQTEKLEKIFTESRERIKIIWNLLGPELHTEHRKVLEEIRAELNDQQKKKLEELLKRRAGEIPTRPAADVIRPANTAPAARPSTPIPAPPTPATKRRPIPRPSARRRLTRSGGPPACRRAVASRPADGGVVSRWGVELNSCFEKFAAPSGRRDASPLRQAGRPTPHHPSPAPPAQPQRVADHHQIGQPHRQRAQHRA